MAKLRIEPTVVEPSEPKTTMLTSGQELYGRCPLHGLTLVFVAREVGRDVVACTRCQRVLVEWQA